MIIKKVIVRLEDFSKYYGDKKIIEKIDLDVYEGEFLTLLGSSGCGKTTILRSISGLDTPSTGKVYIDGVDVTNFEPPQREVNTVFQNYSLFPLRSRTQYFHSYTLMHSLSNLYLFRL